MPKHLGRNRNKYIANKRAKAIKRKKWHEKVNLPAWISALATFITAIFIFLQLEISEYQSNIFDAQTEILEKQTLLINRQNKLFEEQNIKIDSQNVLFGRQNDLVNIQNSRTDAQNLLIGSQNELLDFQNSRISQQTNLQEAERRSAIVYLFSNVLDKIDEELKQRQLAGENRTLSTELIARIASLTQALKPYKYLNNDTIISRAVSPEKGQLLSALINFNLESVTYDSIFSKSNFRSLELENAFLKGANFRNLDLSNSIFYNCNLSNSHFKNTKLINVMLNRSDISNATFENCDLRLSEIKGVNAFKSWFLSCDYFKTDFSYSNLTEANFDSDHNFTLEFGTFIDNTDLNLNNSANLERIKTFTAFKLSESLSGVYKEPRTSTMLYHTISVKLEVEAESSNKKILVQPYQSDKVYMNEVIFDNVNLTDAELQNYTIKNSSFDSTLITNIKFKNITLSNTYFENAKLDSGTYKNIFKKSTSLKRRVDHKT